MSELKALSVKGKAQLVFIALAAALVGTGVGYGIGWFQMRTIVTNADDAAALLRGDIDRINGELTAAKGETTRFGAASPTTWPGPSAVSSSPTPWC